MPINRAKLAALGLGCTVSFAVGEVAVRIIEPREDTKAVGLEDSERIYGYQPKSSGFAGGTPFVTNSWGYRGPDVSCGEQDFVVVALGDSYTFGYGVPYEQAYPTILGELLEERLEGRDVCVVNLAIPGYNTRQALGAFRERENDLNPDVLLLGYLLNDIKDHRANRNDRGERRMTMIESIRHRFHLFRFLMPQAARLSRVLGFGFETTASAEVSDYINHSDSWKENQRTILELQHVAENSGATLAVIVLPYFVDFSESHPAKPAYDEVTSFLRMNQIPCTNALDTFMGLRAREYWIHPSDGHPNGIAHQKIAGCALGLIETTETFSTARSAPP